MNSKEQTPNSKLQKSSIIFIQLGLILALLMVYVALEHESFVKFATLSDDVYDPYEEKDPFVFEMEDSEPKPKTIVNKTPEPKQDIPKDLDDIKIDDTKATDNKDLKPTDVEPDEKVETKNPTPPVVTKKEEKPTTLRLDVVQIVPTFPGCTGTNEEKRRCLNKKLDKHIQRNFDVDLAHDLNLKEGKHRINVEFVISESGDIIGIRTRAIHTKLEKEAQRVINKLPKMEPGIQHDKTVKVKFNIPIYFNVVY